MNYDDNLDLLFRVCGRHACRPDVPLESEEYFRALTERYVGPPETFEHWLDHQIKDSFRSLTKTPEWLQGPEWPFHNGKPMTFVGQIDVRRAPVTVLSYDATFYVFWDTASGETRVVIQGD